MHSNRLISKLRDAYATLSQPLSNAEGLYKQVADSQEDSSHHLEKSQTYYSESIKQLEQTLQQKVSGLRRDTETFTREAGLSGAAWPESLWQQWQPVAATSSLTRSGSVTLKFRQEQLPPFHCSFLVPVERIFSSR